MCAIPNYITVDNMRRIGDQVHGVAGEATLVQFLSKPENDAPFEDIRSPSPSEGEMVLMAHKLLEFVPRVEVLGNDFRLEFSSPRRTTQDPSAGASGRTFSAKAQFLPSLVTTISISSPGLLSLTKITIPPTRVMPSPCLPTSWMMI